VWRRTSQIRSCSSAASIRGERWGRLERSQSPSPERWRSHHFFAVAGETLKARAPARIEPSRSIIETIA
jgi:hypothetical protein